MDIVILCDVIVSLSDAVRFFARVRLECGKRIILQWFLNKENRMAIPLCTGTRGQKSDLLKHLWLNGYSRNQLIVGVCSKSQAGKESCERLSGTIWHSERYSGHNRPQTLKRRHVGFQRLTTKALEKRLKVSAILMKVTSILDLTNSKSEFRFVSYIRNVWKGSHRHDGEKAWKAVYGLAHKEDINRPFKVHYEENKKGLDGASSRGGHESGAPSSGVCPRTQYKDHQDRRYG